VKRIGRRIIVRIAAFAVILEFESGLTRIPDSRRTSRRVGDVPISRLPFSENGRIADDKM
jgi:hypothetical protein